MISLGVVYQLHRLPDITEAYINDGLWGDKPEELPDGSFILVRDIKKALEGVPFSYIPNGEKRLVKLNAVDSDAFSYYHMIHMYTKKFGLPHGRGWVNELSSTLQILSYFDELSLVIEAWHMNHHGGTSTGDGAYKI